MPSKTSPAIKERALRMVADHRGDYPSDTALAEAVANKVGVGRETVRRWIIQVDVDAGTRPGASTDEHVEIKKLKAENKRLREDNEILRAATVSSPGSSTPATADRGVRRRHEKPGARGRVDLPGPV